MGVVSGVGEFFILLKSLEENNLQITHLGNVEFPPFKWYYFYPLFQVNRSQRALGFSLSYPQLVILKIPRVEGVAVHIPRGRTRSQAVHKQGRSLASRGHMTGP